MNLSLFCENPVLNNYAFDCKTPPIISPIHHIIFILFYRTQVQTNVESGIECHVYLRLMFSIDLHADANNLPFFISGLWNKNHYFLFYPSLSVGDSSKWCSLIFLRLKVIFLKVKFFKDSVVNVVSSATCHQTKCIYHM